MKRKLLLMLTTWAAVGAFAPLEAQGVATGQGAFLGDLTWPEAEGRLREAPSGSCS